MRRNNDKYPLLYKLSLVLPVAQVCQVTLRFQLDFKLSFPSGAREFTSSRLDPNLLVLKGIGLVVGGLDWRSSSGSNIGLHI